MNYRIKAFIQNAIALLPEPLDYHLYYFVQRKFGGLRSGDPFRGLTKAGKLIDLISKCGDSPEGKTFLEIGTGRTIDVPIGLWLCGAGRIYTVDINPYLKSRLVFESMDILRSKPSGIRDALSGFATEESLTGRISSLLSYGGDLDGLLAHISAEYHAPADASSLDMPDNSVDYMVSTNVFEHIPALSLKAILLETRRVLRKNGLVVSIIDPSDHFSHSDKTVSPINFLRLSEKQHASLSGNKFMYHNRLRASDYYNIFGEIGLNTIVRQESVNAEALELVKKGFPVSKEFASYDATDLCVTSIGFAGTFGRKSL